MTSNLLNNSDTYTSINNFTTLSINLTALMTKSNKSNQNNSRLWEILTYEGDITNCEINYSILAIVFIPFIWWSIQRHVNGVASKRSAIFWTCFIIFLFAFQISLCFLIDCSGISIVWNAVAAIHVIILLSIRKPRFITYTIVLIPVFGAFGVDLYYAVVDVPLTTSAHTCAIMLGVFLAGIESRVNTGYWYKFGGRYEEKYSNIEESSLLNK